MDKKTNTVIVVGAGASREFGLPVGQELQAQIASLTKMDRSGGGIRALRHNEKFVDLLPAAAGFCRYKANEIIHLMHKSVRISLGVENAASIDNFLHLNQDDPQVVGIGKLAIAHCILKAESQSSLRANSNHDGFVAGVSQRVAFPPHQSWIGHIVKMLSSGRDFNEFCDAVASVKIICFNYDRCIERYLFHAASSIYPTEQFDRLALEGALQLIRPYGSLGELMNSRLDNDGFGELKHSDSIIEAAKNIRTFTEGMDSEAHAQITKAFATAKHAIFLGYGYISTNDNFLFDQGPFFIREIYGTAYGLKEERLEYIKEMLTSNCMMKPTPYDGLQAFGYPRLYPEECRELIARFSHVFENLGS